MSYKSVPQEFPARVTHKSVVQECPTRVSQKSVPQECPTRVSFGHISFSNVLAFGFVGSILFHFTPSRYIDAECKTNLNEPLPETFSEKDMRRR